MLVHLSQVRPTRLVAGHMWGSPDLEAGGGQVGEGRIEVGGLADHSHDLCHP